MKPPYNLFQQIVCGVFIAGYLLSPFQPFITGEAYAAEEASYNYSETFDAFAAGYANTTVKVKHATMTQLQSQQTVNYKVGAKKIPVVTSTKANEIVAKYDAIYKPLAKSTVSAKITSLKSELVAIKRVYNIALKSPTTNAGNIQVLKYAMQIVEGRIMTLDKSFDIKGFFDARKVGSSGYESVPGGGEIHIISNSSTANTTTGNTATNPPAISNGTSSSSATYTINGKSFTMTIQQKIDKESMVQQQIGGLSMSCHNNDEIKVALKTELKYTENTYEYQYGLKLLAANNYSNQFDSFGNLCKTSTQAQSPGVNGNTSTTTNGTIVNDVNDTTIQTGINGTTAQVEAASIRQEVNRDYNGNNGANQSKAVFINFITEQYGTNTYAVQYANTLTFNQP